MITAVILTFNEEERIVRCAESLFWCDEILVIDDNSTDETIDRVRSIRGIDEKVRVVKNPFKGNMAEMRNFAFEKAKGDWVLFVDADEMVTKELASEIARKLERSGGIDGYYLPRKDFFMGKFLKYGETGNVRLLRLGKRDAGRWVRNVHEVWEIDGKVGELENPLEHFSHSSIRQFIDSINRWTDLDVVELDREGKKFELFRVFVNPVGKFVQNYCLRLGFLDGFAGFVMAFMMSFQSLVVRVKQYSLKHDLSRTS